ncbi:hypothetical protein KIW84_040047 [Lathyrus oleraceus]|uniref:PPM-type phosphatase domain-containing protein n=1 Tax=Pisum sativum TaxID=3888 RepID=A0A9D5AQB5_PEA|nr:hypothetical protein KIW84_040047 [Pisum sativum]
MTVYKNGGAPPVFQSPKCPRWRLFDYDSSPRTATRCQSSMLQGRRKSQEDRTLCVLDVRIPFPGTMGIREVVVGIVAVFDGHNGAEASEMASKLLMEYFVLHTYFLLDAMLQNVFSANFDDSFHLEILKEALLRAIHDIDVRFSEEASRNNIHSGSTATVVLVADDKFLVSNIGDSKAFLCSENFQSPKEAKASLLELYRQTERDGSVSVWDREKYRLASSHGLNHFAVKELTRDHHPDREDKRTRVEAAGGQVLNWGGLPRVNGQLAITRAIGDVLFKRYLHRMCISKNFNKLFGFLDPNRILVHTKPAEVIQTYIQNKLDGEPKKCYLGPLLNSNHWQLFVICPEDNIIFWFCSLNRSPKKNIKVILEGALEGYHLLRGIKKKKPNWKNIMGHQQDNGWACGYYVMKNMFDIIDACIVERFNEIFTDTSSYEKESIDHIRQLWAQFFLQKVEEQENQEKKDLMTKQKRLKKTYI